ncbi:hypothetical protein AAZX31_11G210700 [Glycine max]|uniref:uncharacterized protein At1g65710 isoform X2 n=1 Tax=Glycine max TaxID=3847 RepID=UPI0003DE8CCD|nr:uncharacterized protein At1g65710 isoform X2 [Glycine max]KAG4989546.1 hypothetical protein JHK85_032529 [Glycine max]KAG4995134.1 hypothetical protein JHK86_031961 [Glycine max]KAG5125133.1 hypothetical protein JHK82_031870 [Glycine max]KAG5146560.1 hypothetical protein JHK84_032103 [Glycine max]KAH1226282.1 Uncharacterized protein GmHk_11G032986 [Glycine max]|eukprot:XP_006591278.1 uncharacterized protein At1g65710 isoform X2 [Glycine max]
MGACLSKKKGSSTATTKSAASSTVPELKNNSPFSVSGVVNVSKPNVEEVKLKKDNSKKGKEEKKHETVPPEPEGHVKKEIFIIKHRKNHDDNNNRVRNNSNSKSPPFTEESTICDKTAPTANMGGGGGGVGVRTSSCTKEEVDAILIQCGRLSRSSSGNAIAAEHKRRYSGSKRSYDFDHCDNDTVSNDDDSKKVNANESNSDLCEEERHQHQHRPRHRQSPSPNRRPSSSSQERRRRTPSREREQQQQRSSSRERRVSRSPGRRSSENTTPSNARNNNSSNNTSSRPGKMVSVPATVSSLVMDKSNNNGSGESGATTGIKRIAVKRNVGAASPRSQSPARANGNGANGNKAFSENQQQPSLSRSNSRKAEQSPYKRNPLSEIEPNSLAFPHSTTNNSSSRVQNRPKKEFETEANQQKTNGNRTASDKGVTINCKTKVQQEEDVKVQSSITDNVVVKTMVPPGVDNLKPPYTLTRSRSSRRSQELDINCEALLNPPPQSYASLLLEDIQNFHQKNTPPVSLPACVTKACSILEAVADLNSNAGLNFCSGEDRRSPLAFQCSRNDYNVPLTTNDYGKREPDAEDPVVESMLVFNDDDVMEPNLHKYVTVNRGGSLGGADMDDQESSGSNSFTVSSGQQHWGVSSSSWEPSSVESKDCWTSRSNYSKEECQRSPLGLEGTVASEVAGRDAGGAKKKLNSQRRECDHQHGSGIGRGRLGANKVLHNIPVVTAAAST